MRVPDPKVQFVNLIYVLMHAEDLLPANLFLLTLVRS